MLRILRNALYLAVEQTIVRNEAIAIAFSGGVDSTLLAKICMDIGVKVTLVTIGFPASHDISLSSEIARKMNLPHKILNLDRESFEKNANQIYNKMKCKVTSHVENCIGFFYIGRIAKANGCKTILTANGCDELFCGYDRFRSAYAQGNARLMELMDEKLENEFTLTQEIGRVVRKLGVRVIQPFLSPDFISFAKSIPIEQKINGPNDMVRKHILRRVAISMAIPKKSAMQRKKALQYGSMIHKNFCRIHRTAI